MKRDVLLLNSSEEVLQVINWRKAVKLLESGKARRPFDYNKTYTIRTVTGKYELPAAIVLVRYVYVPHLEDSSTPTRNNIFKRDVGLLKKVSLLKRRRRLVRRRSSVIRWKTSKTLKYKTD